MFFTHLLSIFIKVQRFRSHYTSAETTCVDESNNSIRHSHVHIRYKYKPNAYNCLERCGHLMCEMNTLCILIEYSEGISNVSVRHNISNRDRAKSTL